MTVDGLQLGLNTAASKKVGVVAFREPIRWPTNR